MMKTKKDTKVINEKTPLLVIAGPMFVELFLNILLNNIDTIMLSHYSENAVGAVGNANQIMFMMIILFNIIATATSVVVAQYLGAKQYEKMDQIYTLAVIVNLVFGMILCSGLVLTKRVMMQMLHVSDEMMPYALTYINIVGSGLFIQAVYNVMLQILRCNGQTKIGMYISVMINLINIIGNYMFLYGPLKFMNLGVAGVGISTVTARTIAVIVAIIVFYRTKVGRFDLKTLLPFPKDMLFMMIKIGLPSAGENLFYTLYQVFLLSLINSMGNDAVNARAYCNSLIAFAMVCSNACATATQIIMGHLVGGGKNDAAYKRVFETLKGSIPVTLGLATANYFLCPYTLSIFTSNPEIIRLGRAIMFVDIFIELGRCLNLTIVSSLKAAGDYIYPLIVGMLCMWGIGATVGYTMGVTMGIGVAGVFIGTASDECIRGIIVLNHFRRRKWVGKAVVE